MKLESFIPKKQNRGIWLPAATLCLIIGSAVSRDMTPCYVAFIVLAVQQVGREIVDAMGQKEEKCK
jgi:hypothetical protein